MDRRRSRLNPSRETIADETTAELNVRSNSHSQPLLFNSHRRRRQRTADEMRATHKTNARLDQRSNDRRPNA
jgi:hypothetical protein